MYELPKARTLSLDFSASRYEGLEIVMEDVSIGEYLILVGENGDDEEILSLIAKRMSSWNMAMTPSLENVMTLPRTLIFLIVFKWIQVINTKDDGNLGKGLTSGEIAMEDSLPMAEL